MGLTPLAKEVIPEIGYAATAVAFGLALYGVGASAAGAYWKRPALVESAQNAAIGVFVLVTLCMLLLEYAFIFYDFSVRYVAMTTNRGTPLFYRIGGLWGALEGSIVLWEWMVSLYTLLVIRWYRSRGGEGYPWVLSILLGVSAFFLLVMTIPAPPFARLTPIPPDGRGLNPLLEDTGMVTHPIFLYLGFTGFTVPFAFAMAALITGRLTDEWITTTRRWTILAWYFLSMGLLIGGWWSYHVLGWGGYWAWDPVENAAFMPWLTATAFLHSVMIQERRRMLRVWNLTLIVLTFSLTQFGTFLTRSGIIGSVHSFTQSSIGIFFLSFIGVVLLFSLSLLAWRGEKLRAQGELDSLISRESAFLLNNLLLVAVAFTVFLGTIFPLIAEAVRGTKMSVGTPFFNRVTIPLFLALIFLMGVGPLIAWRRASSAALRRHFLWPLVIGIGGAAIFFLLGIRQTLALLAFGLALFVTSTMVVDFTKGTRARMKTGEGLLMAMTRLALRQNRRYGGFVVHLGVLLVLVGITGSQLFALHTETTVALGEEVRIGRYALRFQGLQATEESNHFKVTGRFVVFNNRHPVAEMFPAKKFYPQEQQPIAHVAYRSGLFEDLYLVMGDFTRDGQSATVRAMVNPLVSWIWIGGLVLTLGAALAILPDYRRAAS